MKQKSSSFYEFMIVVLILGAILLPQLIGTTMVSDDSVGVDENGLPITTTFADKEDLFSLT